MTYGGMVRGLCFCLLACGCGNPGQDNSGPVSPPDFKPVAFAVFGNTGRSLDDGRAFDTLIDRMNAVGVDFAIDLGNCLPSGTPSESANVLWEQVDSARGRIEIPVYPVAGPLDMFDEISVRVYEARYGPRWYGFTRGGIRFLALDSGDEAYRNGFGNQPAIGEEQLTWLRTELTGLPPGTPVVVFLNRPLWSESPSLWQEKLLPALRKASVALIVSCSDEGLGDDGNIDGMRAVSTGCTGISDHQGPGLFPHVLRIAMNGADFRFTVLEPDGAITEGIPVSDEELALKRETTAALDIPPIHTDNGWNVNQTTDLTLTNQFASELFGTLGFTVFPGTTWSIRPQAQKFAIPPGEKRTFHIQIEGKAPDLGPLPEYRAVAATSGGTVADLVKPVTIAIPKPRTGNVVTIGAQFAETIPYRFDGSPLKIPVDIGSVDTCGRLILYREQADALPERIYISPLMDFRTGVNQFTWNGCDLNGNVIHAGKITAYLFAYSKEAPVTWAAVGPPEPGGSMTASRTLSGIRLETHTDTTIVSYPLDGSMNGPHAETLIDLAPLLGGLPLTGYTRDDRGRVFAGTARGIACFLVQNGAVVPDRSFGNQGYVQFTGQRERRAGSPVWYNGRLYVGLGGNAGNRPGVLVLDSVSGGILKIIDLGSFFTAYPEPPSIAVSAQGVYIAHPRDSRMLHMTHTGEVIWTGNSGDTTIGARDTDGLSFTYGIGTDQYGFTYTACPGTSARCGVTGPDGRGLFRVILVQLPGLRTSAVVPLIEGSETDGLYMVTRGSDIPYVFHVPFTIRKGTIVPQD